MTGSTGRMLLARLACWAGVAAGVSSCGGSDVDARLVGQSEHFRLLFGKQYVATQSVDDLLTALETNWTDTKHLLSMPEGRIDYYLLGEGEILGACELEFAAACQTGHSIYTNVSVDQHELNHAYMALRSPHFPPPFVVEGLAEAIGCSRGSSPPETFMGLPDWRAVLVSSATKGPENVYRAGRQFVRYLVLAFGAERTVQYYAEAPWTADADAFAAHFRGFWSRELDEVWATMQTGQPAWGPREVLPICSCSLAPPVLSAQLASVGGMPEHPYWTWPDAGAETLVWSGFFGSVEIADCNREQIDVAAFETVFARLSGPFFANVGAAAKALRGPFVSDTCADAAAYDLAFASGDATIGVAVSRQPDTPLSVYLRFNASSAATVAPVSRVGSFSVCPSCDFTQAGCQPLPSSGPPPTTTTTGPFIVRWEAPPGPQPVLNMSFSVSPL